MEIETKMKRIVYGYKYAKNDYIDNLYYKNALTTLSQLELPKPGSIRLPKYDKKRIINESKKIVSSFFRGVNLDVSYLSPKDFVEIGKQISFLNGLPNLNSEDIIKKAEELLKQKVKKCSIFDLPIVDAEKTHSMVGEIQKPLVLLGDENFLRKLPICNSSIVIGNQWDKLSVGTYVHEITHGLLERHKGVIENIYNREILSVFMEKVAVDSIDTTPNKKFLKLSEIYRLSDAKQRLENLNPQDTEKGAEDMMYIYGSLMAGVLFDKYQNADPQTKIQMQEDIKNIAKRKLTVEKFLENAQISLDSESVGKYLEKINHSVKDLELNFQR